MRSQQSMVVEQRGPITVVLVDDQQLIRSAPTQALSVGGLDLVREAANALDAIEMVLDLRPESAEHDHERLA
jgi:chemotaxis response regulator CheB